MSTLKSDAMSASSALWLGGLLLTLAGLFGMHGLAGHGTAEMGGEHGGHPAMSASAKAGAYETAASGSAAAHAAHPTTTATATATATVVVTAATVLSDPAGGMGMDMSGAAMCLAVLLLTALALLVGASLRGITPVLFLRSRPARAPVTRTHDPHPHPPDLYALSIQRC